MNRTSTFTFDAQSETTTFDHREEAVAFESLTAEAEEVERAQREAEDPDAYADANLDARPTCPFCGDTNCTQHTSK